MTNGYARTVGLGKGRLSASRTRWSKCPFQDRTAMTIVMGIPTVVDADVGIKRYLTFQAKTLSVRQPDAALLSSSWWPQL